MNRRLLVTSFAVPAGRHARFCPVDGGLEHSIETPQDLQSPIST